MSSTANLTPEQIQEFKDVFNLLDRDGNGEISIQELEAIEYLKGTKVKDMIKKFDLDGNGTLNFYEFTTLMSKNMKQGAYDNSELRRAFDTIDDDRNGTISAQEIREHMSKLGYQMSQAEAAEMVRDVDGDGDGRIDFGEFTKLFSSPV